jgi:hypothetical protein
VITSNANVKYAIWGRNGTILFDDAKKIAKRPASAAAVDHGRYSVRGSCRLGAAGKLAAAVMVSVVALPEGLLVEIFAGLSTHVRLNGNPDTAQLRFTSAGKVEPGGVVVMVSATLSGVPAVTCTIPGTDCAMVKSTLIRENVAEVAAPVTDAVTL